MARQPDAVLSYPGGCPDCGRRTVTPPVVLPQVGDDFDWDVRDYDGFRLFIMQELAARLPARARWTPADLEVVLVEVLSAQFDKLSDMLDRVTAEFTLETARRPETVRRLLNLIGYDALQVAKSNAAAPFDRAPDAGDTREDIERLEQYWLDYPEKMDQARLAGPRAVRTQRRMVTLSDCELRLEEHPLVRRAHAWLSWSGSWSQINVALICAGGRRLDVFGPYGDELWAEITLFHAQRELLLPPRASHPSIRAVLQPYLEAYRLTGQAIELADAVEVGVVLLLSVQVASNYFQSEVRRAVEHALGTGAGGFFEPGRLRFGEDLVASDIIQALMALDGVDNVCLNRFKRLGTRFPDMSASGRIRLEGLEIAVCDNDPLVPARGYFRLTLHGGRMG